MQLMQLRGYRWRENMMRNWNGIRAMGDNVGRNCVTN